eukprot:COSAG06_NODE_2201_length_7352_cov_18.385771_4_plen_62_part_00
MIHAIYVQPTVESANARYFRLQPDALEYYRSKQAHTTGGVVRSLGSATSSATCSVSVSLHF